MLFFVSVGMLLNPAVPVDAPLALLATVAIVVIGKSAAAYLIVRAFRHPKSTALTVSASLAQETVAILPEVSEVANYGFDVTPARLVTVLITERGVCPASEAGLLSLYPEQRSRQST